MTKTLVLVGGGNMGMAMLKGWVGLSSQASPSEKNEKQGRESNLRLYVVEPVAELRSRAEAVVGAGSDVESYICANVQDLPADIEPDLIIFAVKPQIMADVVPDYRKWSGSGSGLGIGKACLFVSIAAGLKISFFETHLKASTPIVRCMPNTPAAIGAGMLVCCANQHVNPDELANVCSLLEVCGCVRTVEDESLMDAVTAISGSGPAYVFHMIEALMDAGEQAGLSPDLASTLALQTVVGSGLMAIQSPETPETLRIQVTSPGGTTAAALDVLRADSAFQSLINTAVQAAVRRSQELGA